MHIIKSISYNINLYYFKSFLIDNNNFLLFRIENNDLLIYLFHDDKTEILQKFIIAVGTNLQKLIQISNNLKYVMIPNENLLCVYDLTSLINNEELKLVSYFKFTSEAEYYLTNENLLIYENDTFASHNISGLRKDINLAKTIKNYNKNYGLTGRGNYFYFSNDNDFIKINTKISKIDDIISFNHSNCLAISDDGIIIITMLPNKLRIVRESKIFDFTVETNNNSKIFVKNIDAMYVIFIYYLKLGKIDTFGFYNNKICKLDTIFFKNYDNKPESIQTNGEKFMLRYKNNIIKYDISEITEYILRHFVLSILRNILDDNTGEYTKIIVSNEDCIQEISVKKWIGIMFNNKVTLKRFEHQEEIITFRDEFKNENNVNIMTIVFDLIKNYNITKDIIKKLPNVSSHNLVINIICQLIKNTKTKNSMIYLKNILWTVIFYVKQSEKKVDINKLDSVIKKAIL